MPVPPTPFMDLMLSTTPNPFERLKNHTTITAINLALTPWLIAEYGIDFADWDNDNTATHMIAHVITSQQLGGYTKRTFPAVIDGHRIAQVTFTKFILRILDICYVHHLST